LSIKNKRGTQKTQEEDENNLLQTFGKNSFRHFFNISFTIFLFVLAHYRAFLKTIVRTPNCVFLSLVDDIHIVGLMNELSYAFDHLLTQLTQVGLKVKVSKCKF